MIRNGDANFVAREPNVRSDLALLNKPAPNEGPNENKISHRWREQAWLAMDMFS